MDDDFQILFDYVEQMKRELAEKDKSDEQTKSAEDEEKKCVHESIETEEAYVCCKCGLVLEDIFQHTHNNMAYCSDSMESLGKSPAKRSTTARA